MSNIEDLDRDCSRFTGCDISITPSPIDAGQVLVSDGDGSWGSTSVEDALNEMDKRRTLDAEEIILNIDLERVKDLLGKLPDRQLEFLGGHLEDVKTCIEREQFKRT